jgi:epoxyqueuosine reductase
MSDTPNLESFAQTVVSESGALGLSVLSFGKADEIPEHELYMSWLAAGLAGDMSYLHRDAAPRKDVRLLLAEAKSVVVVALPYASANDETSRAGHGNIARYARGQDYHLVLKRRLQVLAERLSARCSAPMLWRACVDTAPLMERAVAARAGLGFVGKNTLLITPGVGSYTVLGELLLSISLPSQDPQPARCGDCRLCLDACPTQALFAPFQMDSRRCISYLTIENSGEIPASLRSKMGDWIFGCDLCQTVCPYNVRAKPGDRALSPKPSFCSPRLSELLGIGAAKYRKWVKQTALRRINRTSLVRNVAVAMGNVGTPDDLGALGIALFREPALVRKHIAWAIAELVLRHKELLCAGRELLEKGASVEEDETVRKEIAAALARLNTAQIQGPVPV